MPLQISILAADFCLCENKDADQLCSNCTADQRLCFHNTLSTIPPLLNFKIPAFVCDYTGWLVSGLVENPKDRFSRDLAHIMFHTTQLIKLSGSVKDNTKQLTGQTCARHAPVCSESIL